MMSGHDHGGEIHSTVGSDHDRATTAAASTAHIDFWGLDLSVGNRMAR
jgi:hypothetical protein